MKPFTYLLLIIIALPGCFPEMKLENQEISPNQSAIKANASMRVNASSVLIDNGAVWKDTAGDTIKAQGGCIIKSENTFHWFGPAFGAQKDSRNDYNFYAINHYTSTNLKDWDKAAPAFSAGMAGIPFKSTNWVGRPWVMWNPNTNLYIMVVEWGAGSRNQYGFLTAGSLNGPWAYQSSKLIKQLPDIANTLYPLGDLGVYSEGGNAWLLYTFDKPQANYSQAILKLEADFMTPLPPLPGNYVEFTGEGWKAGVQEAASVIKKGDTYYYFTSLCNGWKSSDTRYRTSSGMAGPWTSNAIVTTNPYSSNSFNTQHDFILPITGATATSYVYFGDRWNNYTNEGVGRNAWYPLSFDINGIPTLNGPDYSLNGGDWYLDVEQGTWSSTLSNNIILNPGFESDFSNWTYSGNASIATASAEVYAGTKAVKSWSRNAYTTTIQNASATNAIGGTYYAKVWSRAGGSFNQRLFQVFVNDIKQKEITLSATIPWTEYVINDIEVPAGATIKLAVSLDANGGAWTQFDAFELKKN